MEDDRQDNSTKIIKNDEEKNNLKKINNNNNNQVKISKNLIKNVFEIYIFPLEKFNKKEKKL